MLFVSISCRKLCVAEAVNSCKEHIRRIHVFRERCFRFHNEHAYHYQQNALFCIFVNL